MLFQHSVEMKVRFSQMRLSTRIRIVGASVLGSLLLLVALVGTASAFTVHPHISVNKHHVVTDSTGCAAVKVTGSGYTESTNTVTNYAYLTLSDSDTNATPYFGNDGLPYDNVPVNKEGKFSDTLLICADFVYPGDVFDIGSADYDTGQTSNTVLIRAD
jgi:hypothetical protein